MKQNRLVWIAVAALVLGLLGSYGAKNNGDTTASPTQSASAPSQAILTVSYDGIEGKNALELLKASHQVETKKYDFGELVESIDGQKSDSTKYWILYADGKMSNVGASELKTTTGQKIEWKLEAAK